MLGRPLICFAVSDEIMADGIEMKVISFYLRFHLVSFQFKLNKPF